MNLKPTRPELLTIQSRFFEVMENIITSGKCHGLGEFCKAHELNRSKYSHLKSKTNNPSVEHAKNYSSIDVDALTYICKDYDVSPEWLLLGQGKMFR